MEEVDWKKKSGKRDKSNNTKLVVLIIIAIFALGAIIAFIPENPKAKVLALNIQENPIVLRPGEHHTLSLSISPESPDEIILWSSTNKSVANVSPEGKVEAINVGLTRIIATSELTGVADTTVVYIEHSNGTDNKAIVLENDSQQNHVNVNSLKFATPKDKKSSKHKDFGYATYKGHWPNDVNGRMEFKTSHIIDSKDPKGRVAQPGDYVVGEWSNGHLVQGIWYGADKKVKGSIIIGK